MNHEKVKTMDLEELYFEKWYGNFRNLNNDLMFLKKLNIRTIKCFFYCNFGSKRYVYLPVLFIDHHDIMIMMMVHDPLRDNSLKSIRPGNVFGSNISLLMFY